MNDQINVLKEEEKEKMEFGTQEETPERLEDACYPGKNSGWISGVLLIILGIIFLVANVTGHLLQNWWAIFIFFPAIANFAKVWNIYREHGRLTSAIRRPLTGGLILTLVASAFLFELDWGLIWPLFFIIGGLAVLLGGWLE